VVRDGEVVEAGRKPRAPRALCRATDEEVQRWQSDAAEVGRSLSDHVRHALDGAPRLEKAVRLLLSRERSKAEDDVLRLLDPVRWERATRT